MHSYTCNTLVTSHITHNGVQHKIGGFYEADIHCDGCGHSFAVEGVFKYLTCKYHGRLNNKNDPSRFNYARTVGDLYNTAKKRRYAALQVDKAAICHVFPECCLLSTGSTDNDKLERLFLYIKDHTKYNPHKAIKEYRIIFDDYDSDWQTGLNPQRAIQSPMIEVICPRICIGPSVSEIARYDMASAYISVLQDTSFILPTGRRVIRMYGPTAKNYISKKLYGNNEIVIIAMNVIPPKSLVLPFYAIKAESGNIMHGLCKQCVNICNTQYCDHVDNDRRFNVVALLDDYNYGITLGYKCDIFEIQILEGIHQAQWSVLSQRMKQYRARTNCGFSKIMSKRLALQGLGRFATHVCEWSQNVIYKHVLHLRNDIEDGKVNKLHYVNDYLAFGTMTGTLKTAQCRKISTYMNLNSIVFALIANYVKRTIHMHALHAMHSGLHLIRIDVDCLTLAGKNIGALNSFFQDVLNTTGRILNYKVEMFLDYVISRRKRAYWMQETGCDTVILKACGFSIPILQRKELSFTVNSDIQIGEIYRVKHMLLSNIISSLPHGYRPILDNR